MSHPEPFMKSTASLSMALSLLVASGCEPATPPPRRRADAGAVTAAPAPAPEPPPGSPPDAGPVDVPPPPRVSVDAGTPQRVVTLAGLTLSYFPGGMLRFRGTDLWGASFDTLYESMDFFRRAVPTIEHTITREQTVALRRHLGMPPLPATPPTAAPLRRPRAGAAAP